MLKNENVRGLTGCGRARLGGWQGIDPRHKCRRTNRPLQTPEKLPSDGMHERFVSGHDFSRAEKANKMSRALAPAECLSSISRLNLVFFAASLDLEACFSGFRPRNQFAFRNLFNRCLMLGLLAATAAANLPAAPHPATCQKIVLTGEVSAGQEWNAPFGQGWVFRVLPIQGYSGWDLVVDREQPAGYPDALLLATPPYNSINEREVGTTYGLRAQDAIGWNPRSFRFLTTPEALKEAQKLFPLLGSPANQNPTQSQNPAAARAARRLMALEAQSAAGQFRILDAKLAPGVNDAAPYAENWAIRSARTTHTIEPPTAGKPLPFGELHWMKFSVTLWLPEAWKAPRELKPVPAACE